MNLSKIKAADFRGEDALRKLVLLDPKVPEAMIKRSKEIPCYDGKEVVVMCQCFLRDDPPILALWSYISGNDNPNHNGWLLRWFEGVKENSAEHNYIMERIMKLSGASLVNYGQFEI